MPFARRASMRMTHEQACAALLADGWRASDVTPAWHRSGVILYLLRDNPRHCAIFTRLIKPRRNQTFPQSGEGRFAAVRYAQQLAAEANP